MLGLQKGTVRLVPHNPAWQQAFEQELRRLQLALGEYAPGIEHVGSTAVPDLEAKPVLDILLGAPTLDDFATCNLMLEELGYHFSRAPEPGWWFHVKGPEISRTHYLHLCVFDSAFWHDHIRFRDYLRSHEQVRRDYEELKRDLARDYADDRPVYTEGKSDFILSVLKNPHERNR
ncbi:MAG: GrpB family protein [Candidatus Cloacimonetes bacterium]|nr:GrpB family protein [Candidatus Cloacimonadota bacterium]